MTFKEFIYFIISTTISPLLSLFLGAAVVFFLWNVFVGIKNSDNPDEVAKSKTNMVWGIVAIAVMVSMWGLVNFFTGSLRLQSSTPVDVGRFSQPL